MSTENIRKLILVFTFIGFSILIPKLTQAVTKEPQLPANQINVITHDEIDPEINDLVYRHDPDSITVSKTAKLTINIPKDLFNDNDIRSNCF